MSGLDTSQIITDDASQHAEELHIASRPHKDVSGQSPLAHEESDQNDGSDQATSASAGDESSSGPTE